MRFSKHVRIAVLVLVVLLGSVAAKAWHDTMRDPVVQRVELEWDALETSQTHRIVLLADLHVSGPDMPPDRLAAIVEQVNAIRPTIIMIAGDLVSDKRTATRHYSVEEALAPLAHLYPAAAKVAVPGNHDHWRDIDAIEAELVGHGITVLRNQVAELAGITVGGLDDDFTGQADLPAVLAALDRPDRPAILLSHSPDPFAAVPPKTGIMLAGHTHCGQIGWPWGGSPATMSRYGQRYSCGVVEEQGNVLVTSAGLGTSVLPFRLFTQPEIWVIDLVPPTKKAAEP